MSIRPSIELEPAVLLSGSVAEADNFLSAVLWKCDSAKVAVGYVSHWASIMRGRGVEFASHAAACQYWLYEQQAGRLRATPKSSVSRRETAS
jgi:hypothetical protein